MKIVEYLPHMYPELCRWWGSHDGWESIPEYLLPVTGFVVEDEEVGKLRCAGFLYLDGSTPFCMFEWIVANPDNTPRQSLKSLKELIAFVLGYADKNGFVLMTSCQNEGLIKLYKKMGFTEGDTGMTNLVYFPED